MKVQEIIKRINEIALERGANSTKLIKTRNILIQDWVRQKCEFGCKGYARHFTCPPYSPTPEETKKRLKAYKHAILIEFTDLRKKEEQQKIHEIMYDLEKEAFLNGWYKAFAYTAGPCRICGSCSAEKIENPNEYSKRECKNQKKARPSMEACGIDVFQTVRKAGYTIEVIKEEGECFKSVGLLLLE